MDNRAEVARNAAVDAWPAFVGWMMCGGSARPVVQFSQALSFVVVSSAPSMVRGGLSLEQPAVRFIRT